MTRRRIWGIAPWLLAAWLGACVLDTVYYARKWPQAPVKTPDSYDYLKIASDLSDGSLDGLYRRPPGYPLVIALSGAAHGHERPLFYVQLAMHFASMLMIAHLLEQFGASAIWVLAFLVLESLPFSIQTAANVMAESPTEFCLAVGAAGLAAWLRHGRWWCLIAASLALTFAAFVRPTYQLVAPCLIAIMVVALILHRPLRALSRRIAVAAGAMVLCSAVFLGGFVAYNRVRFGYTGTVPAAGFHLCHKTWRVLERLPDEHAAVRDILIHYRDLNIQKDGTPINFIWPAIPDLEKATGLSEAQLSAHLQKLNMLLIRKAPLNYLINVLDSFAAYWSAAVQSVGDLHSRPVYGISSMIHFALLAVLLLVSVRLAGATLLWRELKLPARRQLLVGGLPDGAVRLMTMTIIFGLLFYTMMLSILVDAAQPRYREPTDILLWAFFILEILTWKHMKRAVRAPQA